MLKTLVYSAVLLMLSAEQGMSEQEKVPPPTASSGQCVGTNELEELRYHLYSELTESKKEIDTLRADLNYWQNETLNILKKYLLAKEAETTREQPVCNLKKINERLSDIQYQLMDTLSVCNNTENIALHQVREALNSYRKAQSQEIREIISEISSGQLPLGTFLNPAPSCKYLPDNSSSGNYWIQNTGTGYASLEYCDMTRRCCNSSGGWMRVAHLNMTDPTHHCPRGFRYIDSPKRTCGRPRTGCYPSTYSVDGISYSRVCGRIKAYQFYSTDAFYPYYTNRAVTIDDVYVDGVSLTHGQNPRKHIWTFVSALDEVRSTIYVCPCTKTDTPFTGVVPPFVSGDYFCDTGSRYHYVHQFYSEDPLWDGAGCGDTSTCCQFNNPPWFCKQLPQPTTDDIELRLCADSGPTRDEDIAIEQVELFVQ